MNRIRFAITLITPLRERAEQKPNKTMDNPSQSKLASNQLPVLPSRAELKVADAAPILPKLNSLDDLAHTITGNAVVEIQKFVALGNPLDDPEQSAWLWLRADGSIDAVYDTDRETRRLKGAAKGSLFLEAFKCRQDSTPNSKFHHWILDDEGGFIGDIATKLTVTNPMWDRHSEKPPEWSRYFESVIEILDLQRFRLEPYTSEELRIAISAEAYARALQERVAAWLVRGEYIHTVGRLNAQGLVDAIKSHGNRFIYAIGRKNIYAALVSRMKDVLARGAAEARR